MGLYRPAACWALLGPRYSPPVFRSRSSIDLAVTRSSGRDQDSRTRGSRGSGPSGPAVLTESAFVPLLRGRIQRLIAISEALRPLKNGTRIPKGVVSEVEDEAHDVETFLDDHDARSNRKFAPLTELIACARGFAQIDRTVQHVLARFPAYHDSPLSGLDREFLDEAGRTAGFAGHSLRNLLDAVVEESHAVLGSLRVRRAKTDAGERARHATLPHDLAERVSLNVRETIAELASLYLVHKHTLDALSPNKRIEGVQEMRHFVLEVSDEEQCRFFQTRIHNLQSKYDTFVKATEAERRDHNLKRFRGHVSLTLHLIECMTHLVHFYERHENEIRGDEVKHRVAAIVDKDEVLDRAVNFCLYFAHSYLTEGAPLAESLVKRYTSQARLVLDLPEGVHIHIRPAALIAEVVKHHATPVKVTIGADTRYAGSALDILMAAGANAGERKITFDGDQRPLEDLRLLFEHRLGEDGLGRLPRQLSYLRHAHRRQ